MASVSLLPAASVAGLSCPYCGRAMPVDQPGLYAAQDAWGFGGAVAHEGDRVVGLLLLAAAAEPGQHHSASAAMISTAWVLPGFTGNGLGRHLVRRVAAGLVRQPVSSLIAVAGGGDCSRLPAGWLRAVGFGPTRQSPIWRLELAQTLPTPGGLRSVLERWVDAVRPLPPPEPVGRTET